MESSLCGYTSLEVLYLQLACNLLCQNKNVRLVGKPVHNSLMAPLQLEPPFYFFARYALTPMPGGNIDFRLFNAQALLLSVRHAGLYTCIYTKVGTLSLCCG